MTGNKVVLSIKYVPCKVFASCTHLPEEEMAVIAIPHEDGFWWILPNGSESKDLIKNHLESVKEEKNGKYDEILIKSSNNTFCDNKALVRKLRKNIPNLKVIELNPNDPIRWLNGSR